ncbi:MAG: hypothetical protein M3O34_11540 [Chloroflexota bacterium]|nr:hypothetical protein [Chloroflexota bacterium]
MNSGIKSLDISNVPGLIEIAEEVRRTREPRVLRRNHEDLAIILPAGDSAPRRSARSRETVTEPLRSYSLETAAGSVVPPTRTADIEAMIEAAKEARAERLVAKLSER